MKIFCLFLLFATGVAGCNHTNERKDREGLLKTTAAIREAFGKGDVPAIVALHHPNVEKYFGGNNVVNGRDALKKGLVKMFSTVTLQFVDNRMESLVFNGNTAVETSIFTIKSIPRNGDSAVISKGRAMVVYVKYKDSPTGWASIREMAQAAPEEK